MSEHDILDIFAEHYRTCSVGYLFVWVNDLIYFMQISHDAFMDDLLASDVILDIFVDHTPIFY